MYESHKEIIERLVKESKKVSVRPLDEINLLQTVESLRANKFTALKDSPPTKVISDNSNSTTKRKKIPIIKNNLPTTIVDFDDGTKWLL